MIALLFSKALFKESYIYIYIYIHFLILLIGFEGFSNPQNTFKTPFYIYYRLYLRIVCNIGCLFKALTY